MQTVITYMTFLRSSFFILFLPYSQQLFQYFLHYFDWQDLCNPCKPSSKSSPFGKLSMIMALFFSLRAAAASGQPGEKERSQTFSAGRESSSRIHSATSTAVYRAGPVRMTTFSSPALIIIRRHMAQEVASERISPVRASFPAR